MPLVKDRKGKDENTEKKDTQNDTAAPSVKKRKGTDEATEKKGPARAQGKAPSDGMDGIPCSADIELSSTG